MSCKRDGNDDFNEGFDAGMGYNKTKLEKANTEIREYRDLVTAYHNVLEKLVSKTPHCTVRFDAEELLKGG